MIFYLGMGCQLIGISLVGICLFTGLGQGDYSRIELAQFISGIILFYFGHLVRSRYRA